MEGKRPVLTARAAQAYFVFATVLCIALGVPILVSSLNTVQYRIPYAFEGPMATVQGSQERQQLLWAAGDTGLVYNLSIAIDKDMSPPVRTRGQGTHTAAVAWSWPLPSLILPAYCRSTSSLSYLHTSRTIVAMSAHTMPS